jgi:hypothetical protein
LVEPSEQVDALTLRHLLITWMAVSNGTSQALNVMSIARERSALKPFRSKRSPSKLSREMSVSELLASRVKKDKTNPYEGVNLHRSNAVRTISGKIYRWNNVRERSMGDSGESDK